MLRIIITLFLLSNYALAIQQPQQVYIQEEILNSTDLQICISSDKNIRTNDIIAMLSRPTNICFVTIYDMIINTIVIKYSPYIDKFIEFCDNSKRIVPTLMILCVTIAASVMSIISMAKLQEDFIANLFKIDFVQNSDATKKVIKRYQNNNLYSSANKKEDIISSILYTAYFKDLKNNTLASIVWQMYWMIFPLYIKICEIFTIPLSYFLLFICIVCFYPGIRNKIFVPYIITAALFLVPLSDISHEFKYIIYAIIYIVLFVLGSILLVSTFNISTTLIHFILFTVNNLVRNREREYNTFKRQAYIRKRKMKIIIRRTIQYILTYIPKSLNTIISDVIVYLQRCKFTTYIVEYEQQLLEWWIKHRSLCIIKFITLSYTTVSYIINFITLFHITVGFLLLKITNMFGLFRRQLLKYEIKLWSSSLYAVFNRANENLQDTPK
jgi:hypothetical protein